MRLVNNQTLREKPPAILALAGRSRTLQEPPPFSLDLEHKQGMWTARGELGLILCRIVHNFLRRDAG